MCLYSLKTSEVLLNPFFWDWMKWMNFLADVDEVLDENKCVNIFHELKEAGTEVFFGDPGWKKTVDQKWLKRMLYGRAQDKRVAIYMDHLPGFLKLIRNTSIHILGNTDDPYDRKKLEGYLRQKYPKLFSVVHRTIEANDMCRKHRLLKPYF